MSLGQLVNYFEDHRSEHEQILKTLAREDAVSIAANVLIESRLYGPNSQIPKFLEGLEFSFVVKVLCEWESRFRKDKIKYKKLIYDSFLRDLMKAFSSKFRRKLMTGITEHFGMK